MTIFLVALLSASWRLPVAVPTSPASVRPKLILLPQDSVPFSKMNYFQKIYRFLAFFFLIILGAVTFLGADTNSLGDTECDLAHTHICMYVCVLWCIYTYVNDTCSVFIAGISGYVCMCVGINGLN